MQPRQSQYKAALSAAQMWSIAGASPIRHSEIRDGIGLLSGGGGNIIILPGTDGTFVVDSGLVTAESHIRQALEQLQVEPLRHVVNTHWHFDHTGCTCLDIADNLS